MGILYGILAFLDSIVYGLAASAVRVVFEISQKEFFGIDQIGNFTNRVYIIMGVLMLFKIVISAIQYLVNPDSLDDKEKGLGGLLKRTVITLALIALTPTLFDFAKNVEEIILGQLPSIVLGSEASKIDDHDQIGSKISYTVLASFISPNTNSPKKVENGVEASVSGYRGNGQINDIVSFGRYAASGCPLLIGNMNDCRYNYMIIVSTLAGAFLCYVLLSMALDIAIRTIKFGIIKMLAPIPISSYVFSKDKLTKFGKMALQVYTDIFIRFIIIYLIIFTVQSLIENNTINIFNNQGFEDGTAWYLRVLVNVAMIFGLFMFAKKAPKFITDLLGLPEVTGGDMADMFKPAWQRIGGFAAPGAAIGAYRNAKDYKEPTGRALRRAFSAGGHALVSRLRDVATGKDFAETYKTSKDAAMARTNRNLEYASRYPNRRERRHQMRQERWDAYTGVTTGAKKASANIEATERAIKARGNAWGRAQAKVVDDASKYSVTPVVDSAGNSLTFADMYALFEKDAPEMYDGQKRELASRYQTMKDEASLDYIRQSFFGTATGDGDAETRNVFAEDVFAISRSGADSETVDRLLKRTITVSSGAAVEVDAFDAAQRINQMNKLRDKGDPIPPEMVFTADEAEALAIFAKELNRTAGNVKLEVIEKQTSEPKSS